MIKMNIDTNKYYNYRSSVLGKYIDRDGAYGAQCWISWIGSSGSRRWMACGELDAKGYNTVPYGVFK